MAASSASALRTISRFLKRGSVSDLMARIRPRPIDLEPLPESVPEPRNWSREAWEVRATFARQVAGDPLEHLTGPATLHDPMELKGNIEHYIGMTQVPTGLIGPLRVNGIDASGDFYVPMATSEGALVASYHRGAMVASQAGGVTSVCLTEIVQRSPSFRFTTFAEAGGFLIWVMEHIAELEPVVREHSRHTQLVDVRPNIDANQITLMFDFTTGDAAGQNMVTICADAIGQWIVANSPIKPDFWVVEGNLSGDKKATALSFTSVRGKKVTAEVTVPRALVESALRTTPERMLEYWKLSAVNGVQSGSIGINGHFANGLAALFLACGQDVACVSEASVGTTRFDINAGGDLYGCVTLPNMIVGSVGGGTRLPTQRECLRLIGCEGEGGARKLAEICAATILCGELSIVAAIAAGDFAKAHALYRRRHQ